ncbi:MAG: YncE family protein, partial [Chitinispirillaceae bacterium]|nr:YncE family protein [Chitinispirillaceae bacterium]
MRRKRINKLIFSFLLGITTCLASEYETVSAVPPSVIFELLALNRDLPTLVKPKYRSPTDLVPSPDGKKIYICEQTAKRIAVFDVASGAVEKRILLPNEVTGCAVAPEEATLYATCSSDLWPNGLVCVVDIASGRVRSRIAVGHGARAPVITPDGEKLFVCNRFDDNVSEIDLAAQQEIRRIEAVREPCCAAITPDGKMLVVGNLLPAELSIDTSTIACNITLIDIAEGDITAHIPLRRGSTSVMGIAVSPDGKYVFATHLIGRFNFVASTVQKGWLHTNNLA